MACYPGKLDLAFECHEQHPRLYDLMNKIYTSFKKMYIFLNLGNGTRAYEYKPYSQTTFVR